VSLHFIFYVTAERLLRCNISRTTNRNVLSSKTHLWEKEKKIKLGKPKVCVPNY